MAEVADPEEGLRVESASRLDWDRDRWLRRPLNAVVNPVKADSDFMSRLLFLLRKVSSIQDPYSPVVNCGTFCQHRQMLLSPGCPVWLCLRVPSRLHILFHNLLTCVLSILNGTGSNPGMAQDRILVWHRIA